LAKLLDPARAGENLTIRQVSDSFMRVGLIAVREARLLRSASLENVSFVEQVVNIDVSSEKYSD
jgi:hypothetical protein